MRDGMNWSLAAMAQCLRGARLVGDGQVVCTRVHTDTRSLQAGDLLVALKGERFDATEFLPQAAASGAVAAVCPVSAERQLRAAGLPGILAPDTRVALGELARHWRQRFAGPLVAVTGSNGKTTVTQMLAAIANAWQGAAALATQGNLNNEIGVPLTLLRLHAGHRVAVVELGMNHPGEIAQLAAMAQPTVGLVNNAQREHQEFMGTVQAVAEENGAVLSALPADGVAVYPVDEAFTGLWRVLAAGRRTLTFGEGADVRTRQVDWCGDHWAVEFDTPVGPLSALLHIAGRHNVRNAMAATAAALAAGAPLAAVAQGLSAFRPVQGRSNLLTLRCKGRTLSVIDDTYNANPDSVRALIDVVVELPGPHLLVLGDMGEVGEQGPAFHQEVGSYARQRGLAVLLTHGAQARHAAQAFGAGRHFDEMDALLAAVQAMAPEMAVVAVKGSRFMRMERVVSALSADAQMNTEEAHAA